MENRKIRFSFTLSTEQRAELKRLAELEELSEAAYLRRLIREAARAASIKLQGEMSRTSLKQHEGKLSDK